MTAGYPYTVDTQTGKDNINNTDWERLLSSLDNGQTNIYDGIYGGPPIDALVGVPPLSNSVDANLVWSPDVWAISAEGLSAAAPQSVLSFSDESLTSGEEFPDLTNCTSNESYRGIMIPEMVADDRFALPGLDGGFGL